MDYTGKIVGRFKVISQADDTYLPSGQKIHNWICVCECGEKEIVTNTILRTTKNPMCKKCRENLEQSKYIGKRFGRLTVINFIRKDDKGRRVWRCKCDCGKERITYTSNLTSGRVKSCGCLSAEISKDLANKYTTKHGKTHERIYTIWLNMRARCNSQYAVGYKNYGGRGIKVCKEWDYSFEKFYEWAISNGYTDSLTLDRKDVNGNYEPDNCRWISQKEQQNNRRNNHWLEMNGEIHTFAEWIDILGITKRKLYYHYDKGLRGNELYKKLKRGN